MTPCEEKGLKPGQWVWCCLDEKRHDRNLHNEWAMLRSDDRTGCPRFSNGEGLLPKTNYLGLDVDIDWSQGIHNTKPHWTPKEYGGDGPPAKSVPVTIQKGDYILREDIPDEATFNAIVAECERQGVPRYAYDPSFSKSNKNLTGFTLHNEDKVCCWFTFSRGKDCRRLTPSDLGINTEKAEQVDDPRDPRFWENAPEGFDYWIVDNDGVFEPDFHRRQGDKYYARDGTFWRENSDAMNGITIYARPTTPEWPGHQDSDEVSVEIFLHSHCDTGKPLMADILSVSGSINLTWLYQAIEESEGEPELMAESFYEAGAPLDEVSRFLCRKCFESDECMGTASYFEPIRRLDGEDTTPEWSGEGLPPVGTVCKVRVSGGAAFPARVDYVGDIRVFLTDMEDGEEMAPYIESVRFATLQSERERVIEGAREEWRAVVNDVPKHKEDVVLLRLYDTGWLKEPEGKQ